jgi:S1-C subfamily serine protease
MVWQALGLVFGSTDDGYVATCWHVVVQNPDAPIRIQSSLYPLLDLKHDVTVDANWVPFAAKVVAHDADNDIALLKTERNPFKTPATQVNVLGHILNPHYKQAIINTELPEAGQKILLAGYPLGLPYPVVQEGTVASIASRLAGLGSKPKILISMVANHGNSGGPVLDDDGKVIGLLEAEHPGTEKERTGIEVAVPAYFLSVLIGTVHD